MEYAKIFVVLMLYAFIWIVPISIVNRRRRHGLRPYWAIFCIALVLEVACVYGFLYMSEIASLKSVGLYLAPIFSAFIAWVFYVSFAKFYDVRRS